MQSTNVTIKAVAMTFLSCWGKKTKDICVGPAIDRNQGLCNFYKLWWAVTIQQDFFSPSTRLFKCQPCYKILHLQCPQCAKSLKSDLTRADSTCPQRGSTLNQRVTQIKCRHTNDVAVMSAIRKCNPPVQFSLSASTPIFLSVVLVCTIIYDAYSCTLSNRYVTSLIWCVCPPNVSI